LRCKQIKFSDETSLDNTSNKLKESTPPEQATARLLPRSL
jgi:hypothetical protein